LQDGSECDTFEQQQSRSVSEAKVAKRPSEKSFCHRAKVCSELLLFSYGFHLILHALAKLGADAGHHLLARES
jgi:hypothetical protein